MKLILYAIHGNAEEADQHQNTAEPTKTIIRFSVDSSESHKIYVSTSSTYRRGRITAGSRRYSQWVSSVPAPQEWWCSQIHPTRGRRPSLAYEACWPNLWERKNIKKTIKMQSPRWRKIWYGTIYYIIWDSYRVDPKYLQRERFFDDFPSDKIWIETANHNLQIADVFIITDMENI